MRHHILIVGKKLKVFLIICKNG